MRYCPTITDCVFKKNERSLLPSLKLFSSLFHRAAPFLLMMFLFTVGATLSLHAQIPNVTAVAPPGTSSADIATAIGWFRFAFGVLAVALFIFACFSVAKHPATGVIEMVACIVMIIAASNAQSIVTAIYHQGNG